MSFSEDLHTGEAMEQEVLKQIQKKYPQAYKIEGYFKDYDIYIPELSKSVEVKKDYKSKDTGNLVIELTFDGKPSALLTTKADFWVFAVPDKYIWTTPDLIKKAIGLYGQDPKKFVGKGDDKPKLAWLIPIEYIEQSSMAIQNK
jgi:hypothetical protein